MLIQHNSKSRRGDGRCSSMLHNARISDSKRLSKKNEKLELRRTGWKVKIDETIRRAPEAKLTWSPQLSPFSQLTLSGRHAALSPLPCSSPQFTPSSPNNSSLDSLTAEINGISLHDNNDSMSPKWRSREPPAALPAVPPLASLELEGAVRPERRSLKELNSPAAAEDSRSNGQSLAFRELGMNQCTVTVSRHYIPQSCADAWTPVDSPSSESCHPYSPTVTKLSPCTQPTTRSPFSLKLIMRSYTVLRHYLSPTHSLPLSPRQKVLALCDQVQPLPLSSYFTDRMVKSVSKLGEGTFAEVFGYTTEMGETLAIKMIPIEGNLLYNDEPQITYHDVLPEMVIMKELSLLGEKGVKENRSMSHFTENFLQIHRLVLCKGEYPGFLLDSWDTYDKTHHSENDRPDMFTSDQLYILMATENAGIALEDYEFSSVEGVVSVVSQVAGALAVGEAALEMEHRDLHMSNVLVKKTSQQTFLFRVGGNDFTVPSQGVKATIVDYTLSRMKQDDCVSFNDLERLPWLFAGEGDIQFSVYRDMKKTTNSNWDQFFPHTNVLWLNYLLTKLTHSVMHSDAITTRSWRAGLRPLLKNISCFSSAKDAFVNLFLSQI